MCIDPRVLRYVRVRLTRSNSRVQARYWFVRVAAGLAGGASLFAQLFPSRVHFVTGKWQLPDGVWASVSKERGGCPVAFQASWRKVHQVLALFLEAAVGTSYVGVSILPGLSRAGGVQRCGGGIACKPLTSRWRTC